MGEAFFKDVLGIQTIAELEEFAESEITATREGIEGFANKAGILLQDTQRGGYKLLDNTGKNVLYTIRDTKSEFLHAADSALDHAADVVDRIQQNVTDTIQIGSILVIGFGAFFIILYGDQLFSHGVRLGRINLF